MNDRQHMETVIGNININNDSLIRMLTTLDIN